jgi:hypothetical protein
MLEHQSQDDGLPDQKTQGVGLQDGSTNSPTTVHSDTKRDGCIHHRRCPSGERDSAVEMRARLVQSCRPVKSQCRPNAHASNRIEAHTLPPPPARRKKETTTRWEMVVPAQGIVAPKGLRRCLLTKEAMVGGCPYRKGGVAPSLVQKPL